MIPLNGYILCHLLRWISGPPVEAEGKDTLYHFSSPHKEKSELPEVGCTLTRLAISVMQNLRLSKANITLLWKEGSLLPLHVALTKSAAKLSSWCEFVLLIVDRLPPRFLQAINCRYTVFKTRYYNCAFQLQFRM